MAGRSQPPSTWRSVPVTQAGLDLTRITAIDVHVHVESDGEGHLSLDDELMAASATDVGRT